MGYIKQAGGKSEKETSAQERVSSYMYDLNLPYSEQNDSINCILHVYWRQGKKAKSKSKS